MRTLITTFIYNTVAYAYYTVFKVNVKKGTWCKKSLQQGHNYPSFAFKFTNCTTFVSVLEIEL